MPSHCLLSRPGTTLALLCALLFTTATAQAAMLRGRVLARDGNRAIEGAVVRLLENERSVRTTADGSFVFLALPPGRYTLSAHHVVFSDEERALELTAAEGATDLVLMLGTAIHPAEQVIVRSAHTSFALRSSPWAAGLRTADQLAAQSAVTPSEEAAALPGVALVRDGTWQTGISIRGMSRSNIVALVDHTRLETANDLAGALSLVNTADLERIEVMKSPGSVLFGSGCLGGAVQMVTKRAPFGGRSRWSAELDEGITSVDGGAAHHVSFERSAARTALRASAAYRDAGNTATPRGDIPNSQYNDWSLATSLGVRTHGEQSLFASYQRVQAENTGITGGTPIAATATATYRLAQRELFSLEYVMPNMFRALPLLTARVSRQDIARNVEIVQSPTVTVTPHAVNETSSFSIESRLLPATDHLLTVGAEAWQRQLDSRRERVLKATSRVVGERPAPRSAYASAGLYVQDDWKAVTDRVRVVLGARRDWSRTRNDRTLSPEYEIVNGVPQVPTPGQTVLWNAGHTRDASWDVSAGMHAQMGRGYSARLLVATAFRSPSLEERFQYLDLGSSLHVGNPDLRPERSRSLNLGGRTEWGAITLDADVFLNTLTDLVAEVPGTFQGRPAFVKANIGRARLYGFELSLEQRLSSHLVLSTSLSHVRGEDTEHHVELPQVAPLSGRAELGGDAGRLGTLRATFTASHAQEHSAPGEARTSGWTSWNTAWASTPVRVAGIACRARAGVDNLFDRAYRQHLSTLRGLVKLEPGRNVYVSLNAAF